MTYQGSKAKYVKYICPILQKCIDDNHITTFIDCMVGGANIIKNIKCENRIATDIDENLIALWQEMQKPDFKWPSTPEREDWDRCKSGQEERKWYIGFTAIFASTMGRGFPGGFERLHTRTEGRMHTAAKDLPLIQGIDFSVKDYVDVFNSYENCVIYCDPPYKGTKTYNYKIFDSEKFWEDVRQASKNNYIFISEQAAPDDFKSIWSMSVKYNLVNATREATENLFVYKNGLSKKYI